MKERVVCRVCGKVATMTRVKLCDSCWDLEYEFVRLAADNRVAALAWLKRQLQDLEET